jgi:hypothetical protein
MAVTTHDEVEAVNIAVEALEPRLRHINQTVNEMSFKLADTIINSHIRSGKIPNSPGKSTKHMT